MSDLEDFDTDDGAEFLAAQAEYNMGGL